MIDRICHWIVMRLPMRLWRGRLGWVLARAMRHCYRYFGEDR